MTIICADEHVDVMMCNIEGYEFKLIPDSVKLAKSPLEAVDGAEALVLATEWKDFKEVDLTAVNLPIVVRSLWPGSTRRSCALRRRLPSPT